MTAISHISRDCNLIVLTDRTGCTGFISAMKWPPSAIIFAIRPTNVIELIALLRASGACTHAWTAFMLLASSAVANPLHLTSPLSGSR